MERGKNALIQERRLSDLNLGMVVVAEAGKDWRGVGRPQVAMHSQLSHFLVATVAYRKQQFCEVSFFRSSFIPRPTAAVITPCPENRCHCIFCHNFAKS